MDHPCIVLPRKAVLRYHCMDCYLPCYILIQCLLVFRDQPLIDYFKSYRAQHGLLPQRPDQSQRRSIMHLHNENRYDRKTTGCVNWKEATIHAGPAKLRFFRTLRVPDNADKYLLPPVRTEWTLNDQIIFNAQVLHRGWEHFPSYLPTDFKRYCHLRSEKEAVTLWYKGFFFFFSIFVIKHPL